MQFGLSKFHCICVFYFQVEKFESKRQIGPETVTNCRELLEMRDVVLKLMDRCERISSQMSAQVNQLISNSDNLGNCQIRSQPGEYLP